MPKCKINGQEVEVEAGTTIIEAFKKLDQDIAHYCWHPGLSVAGVCRLCMVQIEGNPRMQIACNTVVQEGMVVSNQTEDVKKTVKWGLDFHLINHPLDCPICDQAGECQLQIQYMKFGQYDPEMAERKVKKRKVVDLGPKIVLDTERCILCSRCVRFTNEVSETHELGIFNRGDRSEIGTFKDKPLDNPYSMNTVDICPVGALTSKDFRFRQRVWYLKHKRSVCNGCSTGCNVDLYYNEEGLFRVKPVFNENVNGYWMCDHGRDVYKFVNKDHRLETGLDFQSGQWVEEKAGALAKKWSEELSANTNTAVVVTGQYTNEEYESFFDFVKETLKTDQVYHWKNNPSTFEDFDGKLIRGDKNPNTKGLFEAMDKYGFRRPWSELAQQVESQKIDVLVVAGPENLDVFPELNEKIDLFSKVKKVIWLGAPDLKEKKDKLKASFIPLKTFAEKEGTFINAQGDSQKIQRVTTVVKGALTLSEAAQLLSGKEVEFKMPVADYNKIKTNYFTMERGSL
ncbi:MAG: (2Fe-2S)-binding protein [Bdellovibrionales bacterium]|nr:(2Fe-2S)-binding protein [Bdellovibrionales bacterium]